MVNKIRIKKNSGETHSRFILRYNVNYTRQSFKYQGHKST